MGNTPIKKEREEDKSDTNDYVVDTEIRISSEPEADTNAEHNATANIANCCTACQDKVNSWLQCRELYIPIPLSSHSYSSHNSIAVSKK